jgi:hypothetical protein
MTSINKGDSSQINRGVELILRRENRKSKTFQYCFEKVVSFFNREVTIYFNFSFDIRKQK